MSDDLIDFTDFLPTLAKAASAELPPGVTIDGRSFLPQLCGEKGKPREWIFCQLRDRWFIRDERWMLNSDSKLFEVSDRYEPARVVDSTDATEARMRLSNAVTRLLAQ